VELALVYPNIYKKKSLYNKVRDSILSLWIKQERKDWDLLRIVTSLSAIGPPFLIPTAYQVLHPQGETDGKWSGLHYYRGRVACSFVCIPLVPLRSCCFRDLEGSV